MIKTLKWVYKLGFDNANSRVFRILEQERDFHLHQSQIKAQQEAEDRFGLHENFKVSPVDHEQRYKAIKDALYALDPERYPDIDKFLELMK